MNDEKCYYKGKDLDKIKKGMKMAWGKSREPWDEDFVFEEQYKLLDLMNDLVETAYLLNDYKAACWCHLYTVPKATRLIYYVEALAKKETYVVNHRTDWSIKKNVRLRVSNDRRLDDLAFMRGMGQDSLIKQYDGSMKMVPRLIYIEKIKRRHMAIAARYFIHDNINFLEWDKLSRMKAYPRREYILRSYIWWCNQMMLKLFDLEMPDCGEDFNFRPKEIIFSTMPSSGKSFVNNTVNEMFAMLGMVIWKSGGVLRVGNTEENIGKQSRMTRGLMTNPLIVEVYPELARYVNDKGTVKCFEKEAVEEFQLAGCVYEPSSTIVKTSNSALNSVRCRLGIFDDPSGGLKDANNVKEHERITSLYNGDFKDRFDSPADLAILLTGTMYNPFDVFATRIKKALEDGAVRDKRFINTFISKDREAVVIVNDCEDERGYSAFPEFITTKELQKKKDEMTPYIYNCVWRQKPIPAEGLLFSKEYLKFYDKLPDNLTPYSFCTIDPTRRRASDYFAMPILKYCPDDGLYYLVDVIFERKSTNSLLDQVVNKMVRNKVIKCRFEENIDHSLGTLLEERMKKLGVTWCDFKSIYSFKNKQARINDLADDLIKNVVFPSETYANTHTKLGFAVYQLLQYNGDESDHDDFPDALCMFVSEFIVNADRKNIIKTSAKLPWG